MGDAILLFSSLDGVREGDGGGTVCARRVKMVKEEEM